jgi:hypothetical protein
VKAGSSQILFRKTNDFSFKIRQDTIDFIQISLKDDLEQFINLNNVHWNLTLQFTSIRDINRFAHNTTFFDILQGDIL